MHLPPYSPDLNPIEFAWKDAKREFALLDFEGIREKVKSTIEDIMEERKRWDTQRHGWRSFL